MNKFNFSKLFLSLLPIILSGNLVNAKSEIQDNVLLEEEDGYHCESVNNCNKFVAPITASIMGSLLVGLHYSREDNIIKDAPLVKQFTETIYTPVDPITIPFEESISAAPVSSVITTVGSLFSPDPLLSSAISKGFLSIPASSTIVSSIPGSTSYSSYNSSFFSRIPFALSSVPISSPVSYPSVFGFLASFFPKQDYSKPVPGIYISPKIDYKTRYKDFEFNAVVTFGDSLSDSGRNGRNSVYMANGDVFNLYNTLLSVFFTGKPNVPNLMPTSISPLNLEEGGVNYAVSGSIISAEGLNRFDLNYYRTAIDDQIEWYLSDNGGRADPNSLYLYWAGGNDLANKLSATIPQDIIGSIFSLNPKERLDKIFDENGFYDDKEIISKMVKSVGKLLDAGAGYVFFMNLPASGYAPFTQMFLEGATLGSVDLIVERLPLILLSPSYWLSKIADDYLRNPANHIGDPKGRGKDYIIENNVAALKHRYFFLPENLLRFYYNFASSIQNAQIRQFNNEAKRQLSGINYKGNLVYVDVDSLFTELLDNYQYFGIDEILVPQCQLGLQSTSCNANDSRYHDDKVYAFTDWHHPSAYSHLIIAQYIASILNAPVFVAALTRNLENIDISRKDFLNDELRDFRSNIYKDSEGLLIPIVGYSGLSSKLQESFVTSREDYTNILHAGVAYIYSPNLTFGALGSFGFAKQTPHNEINFKQNNQSLTLFSQYIYNDSYWANISFTGGLYKANDINRITQFGQGSRSGNRIETGSTKGRLYNLNLKMGYNFNIKDYLTLSPSIGYSTSKYKINAYEENNNLSTSMRFGKQDSTSHILSAGLDLFVDRLPINTSFEINYNHSLNNKDLVIDSVGIKSADLTFSRDGMSYKDGKSKDWIDISPRLNFRLGKNTYLNTSISYEFDLKGKQNNSRLNYNLGIRTNF